MTAALRKLLRGLELDDAGEARAALAPTLAQRIDAAPVDTSLAAIAAVSKELRAVLEALVDPSDAARRTIIDGIFGP